MSSLYKIRKKIQKWISKHSMHKPLYKANWHAPCSDEEDLQQKLNDLEFWLIDRGYRTEVVRLEIQKVNSIDRDVSLEKRPKHQEDGVKLILTFHSALHVIFDILKSAHGHFEKSPLLKSVLPKLSRVAFRNPKSLHYKLIWSKPKSEDEKEWRNFPCCRKNCDICNILYPSNKFRSTVTGEEYKMNFHFNCNSICVVYLLTCKICAKQYTGSTITKFRSRFNQYKSNIKLYGEGRRYFVHEKLIEHFYSQNHHGTHGDMIVQIINQCDPNYQEKRENVWIHKLKTLYPDGLNQSELFNKKLVIFCNYQLFIFW